MSSQDGRRRVTIRDVARLAGVSAATVSQILRGHKGYASEATTERVLAAVVELDYRPNAIAQSLVTARTRTLGLVIGSITGPLFPQVLAGIEQVARQQDYSVLLICASDTDREREAVRTFRDKRVDGMVFMTTSREQHDLAFISETAEKACPVVVINRPLGDPAVHEIVWDDVGIGRMATQHLIDLGHTRIAHIGGNLGRVGHRYRAAVERLVGNRQALAGAGLAIDEHLVVEAGHSYRGAFEAMERLLGLAEPPTGVFAVDDTAAVGAMNALRRAGYSMPQDMSVVGAGGAHGELFTEPPLTTVHMPIAQAGQKAAEFLIALLDGEILTAPHREVLAPKLVVRESTGAPPGGV